MDVKVYFVCKTCNGIKRDLEPKRFTGREMEDILDNLFYETDSVNSVIYHLKKNVDHQVIIQSELY